jgi:hypothetical protein
MMMLKLSDQISKQVCGRAFLAERNAFLAQTQLDI